MRFYIARMFRQVTQNLSYMATAQKAVSDSKRVGLFFFQCSLYEESGFVPHLLTIKGHSRIKSLIKSESIIGPEFLYRNETGHMLIAMHV